MRAKVAKRLRREATGLSDDFVAQKDMAAKKADFHVVDYIIEVNTIKVPVQMDEEGKVFEEMELDEKVMMPVFAEYILPPNSNQFMNGYRNMKKAYLRKEYR